MKFFCNGCRKSSSRVGVPTGRTLAPCRRCCGWRVAIIERPLTNAGAIFVGANGNRPVDRLEE